MSGLRSLTFGEFAAANRARCEAPNGFNEKLDALPMASWALAVAGEVGELAGAVFALAHQPRKKTTAQDVAYEIADVVAYCDLLAQRLGFDLGAIVAEKWNRVSARVGYPGRLPGFAKAPVLHWCLAYETGTAVCGAMLGNTEPYAADWDRSTCPACIARRP